MSKKETIFEQNNRNILLYHIISPIVILIDVLVLIIKPDEIIGILALTVLNILINMIFIKRTYNVVEIDDKTVMVKYKFSPKQSIIIKKKDITKTYINNKGKGNLSLFFTIEINYKENTNIKKYFIFKGFRSYEDFEKLYYSLGKSL